MSTEHRTPSKRFALHTVVRGILLATLMACSSKSKTVLVLVDTSKTILPADSILYRSSFETVLRSMKSGDRLVLATISDQTTTNYRIDADIPFSRTGIELDDEEAKTAAEKRATEAFSKLLEQSKANETRILDALEIAQEVFSRDSVRPIHLVLLESDMVLEAGNLNFRTSPIDSVTSEKFFAEAKKSGALPNLAGTRVWVVGASGSASVRRFWLRYFKETGAICDPTMYGRTALISL